MDPIADQFAWVSVFNYAENEPVGHIDLHGLQKAIFNIESEQGSNYQTSMEAITKVASHLTKELQGVEAHTKMHITTRVTQIDVLLTAASIHSIITNNSISEQSKSEKLSAMAIGEIVSLYNPIVGLTTGTLIQNATEEDGLTNLKNNRMVDAYSQNFKQNQLGNFHFQKALGNPQKVTSKNAEPEFGYYMRSYAETDVLSGHDKTGKAIWSRERFFEGSEMYEILTAPSNSPGSPGHNPTTSFGKLIYQYKRDKQ